MKIGIVGTGAMGSVYAGYLTKAGHEVWAIDSWQEHIDAIAESGLAVSGPSETFVVDALKIGRTPKDAGPCDVWVISTKAQNVAEVATSIAPLLETDSMVMAFQNGLGSGERVARHLPRHHILIGIAEGFGASVPQPGCVHHEGMRLIRIGEMQGGLSDRVLQVERMWREASFNVKAFADIDLMIWEKFLCNVTLSAPCAAFDVTVGELMASPEMWEVALGCTMEAYLAGVAKGVSFSFDDPLRYVTEFAATIPNASPSMRLDHLARRRSEVDVINGQVVELSQALGLSAPYNQTLCAILRRRESSFEGACAVPVTT
ncbi:MAG: ketopantoate reductase family protein, partial [Nitrososphaerales archaeon]